MSKVEHIIILFRKGNNVKRNHLRTAAIVGGTVAGAILAPFAVVGAVGALGFGAAGVAAGSAAAAVQSVVYGGAVTSGSLFAICQSIGAAGLGIAGAVSSATVGAAAGAAISALSTIKLGSDLKKIKILVAGARRENFTELLKYINSILPASDRPLTLQLLDNSKAELEKYAEELKKIGNFDDAQASDDNKLAFKDIDVAFLFVETEVREKNEEIYKDYGERINSLAKKNVKVIIFGSKTYGKENHDTCRKHAPSVPSENFIFIKIE